MRKDKKTGQPILAFGYNLTDDGAPIRGTIDTKKPGDWGRDPLGDGKYRMVPSGDIVGYEESQRRLSKT